jgi:nucleotide-binding universal stress UspA family protein
MAAQLRDTLLVPTDFSVVADFAIDHASEIAKIFNHKICLLHIISKKTENTPKAEELRSKLENQAGFLSKKTGLEVSYIIETGTIFRSISEVADRIHAEFIVMGIHGRKGVQHIIGSYAYKVVVSANVPVLLVKDLHHHVGYKNIVIPIDFSRRSDQKVTQAIRFSKYFGAHIRVFGFLSYNSPAYVIKKEVLLKNVAECFNQENVQVSTTLQVNPGLDWPEALIKFSKDVDADLIMIVAEKDSSLKDVFSSNLTERIIDKMETPVLTICRQCDPEPDFTREKNPLIKTFVDPMGLIKGK